jgi:SOS-response transcriptional repressor LexA
MALTGRKQKYDKPLDETVKVLFTEDHLPVVSKFAKQSGINDVSTWAREVLLGERPHPMAVHPADIGTDSLRLKRLSKVPCGDWREAIESADSYTLSPDVEHSLEAREGDVIVPAEGDSMEGARIFDGDQVLMRPLPDGVNPRRKEIALVQVFRKNGQCEGTIKRWVKSNPPELEDGNGKPFPLPKDVQEVRAVAVARGLIARLI